MDRDQPGSWGRMLPTPLSGKVTDENEAAWLSRHAAGKVASPPLALAARMWGTPTGRDHKDAADPSLPSIRRNADRGLLGAQAAVEDGRPLGRLNPAFVCRMMGFPDDWLLDGESSGMSDHWEGDPFAAFGHGHEFGVPMVVEGKVPERTHRLKALGNAVVPQVVLAIFEAINECEGEG